jgi:hypothetical protein
MLAVVIDIEQKTFPFQTLSSVKYVVAPSAQKLMEIDDCVAGAAEGSATEGVVADDKEAALVFNVACKGETLENLTVVKALSLISFLSVRDVTSSPQRQ